MVKNRVTTQKKSLGQKFGETFLSDESEGVGSYIFNDVLIPALKDTFVDMVEGAINMAFYGDTRRRSRGRSSFSRGSVERVSYDDRTVDVDRLLEDGLDTIWTTSDLRLEQMQI